MTEDPFKHLNRARKEKGLVKREVPFDKKCGAILKQKLGLWNWKPYERARAGIPDRYVIGGNWIEFKHVIYPMRNDRNLLRTNGKVFSPAQIRTMDDLVAAGDRVFVCILISTPSFERVLLEQWDAIRRDPILTIERVRALPENALAALSQVFDKHEPRFSKWRKE